MSPFGAKSSFYSLCVSGSKYVGEWAEDKRHGRGTFNYTDGRKYVGEFKEGVRHGRGTFTGTDGQKYVGGYKEDKRHGTGTLTFIDGSKYVGEWKEHKRHGRDAIDRTCKENPGAYMRAVLSLVPKDFALTAKKDETPQCIEIKFVD